MVFPLKAIVVFLFWFFIIGPILENSVNDVLDTLNIDDNICPEEFNLQQYNVCFSPKGDVIAKIGVTGKTTGAHVHFEIRGAKNPF